MSASKRVKTTALADKQTTEQAIFELEENLRKNGENAKVLVELAGKLVDMAQLAVEKSAVFHLRANALLLRASELDPAFTSADLTAWPSSAPSAEKPVFREVNDADIEMEEDEGSSSEEEEAGTGAQEEHLFRLAKAQYEDILAAEPTNFKIRQRYENMLQSHAKK